ncbi:MAG TPA: glycosyltransferase family 39 protein [Agriterribacter sp.]|nr:glycosyltransferase family 39 protein [Agriterribacter sp.]
MMSFGDKKQYIFLYFILGICYVLGLFIPLMNGDASHHANIALHMYQNNNYVDLVDRGQDYLDKPHLLFWLAAACYHLFGVTPFAYKLPSLLFSIAAVWATYKTGKRLYNAETGRLAALILAAAQAFILACMDVRMDAILTACIILAAWQLLETATGGRWYNIIAAALFMALGFSTKGMAGIVIPCAALFFYLLYTRNFAGMLHIKWILTGSLTLAFMLPVLYCYYLQFDLHPEKEIRGMTHISGVKFILWGQNIERLDGTNWGGGKKDYFFYFHTLLWAFLPWSLLAYYATGSRLKALWRTRLTFQHHTEAFTIGTVVFVFVVISGSQFQLPHYLNILFPFLSLLTAAKLVDLDVQSRQRPLRIITWLQTAIALLIVVLVVVLCVWSFSTPVILIGPPALAAIVYISWWAFNNKKPLLKIATVSVTGIALVNFILFSFFYPRLLRYEGGLNLAAIAREQQTDLSVTYFYNTYNFAFDFETRHLSPTLFLNDIREKQHNVCWLLTDTRGMDSLKQAHIPVTEIYESNHFRISRLKASFLSPATRQSQLDTLYLLKVSH